MGGRVIVVAVTVAVCSAPTLRACQLIVPDTADQLLLLPARTPLPRLVMRMEKREEL